MTRTNSRGGAAGPRAPLKPSAAPPTRLATYYALLVTQTVSLIGSQISQYAISIAVFRATGHVTPLALVACCGTLPAIVLGGFAGALADRFSRRAMMLTANVGFAVTSGIMLLSFASGAFQLWHLYVLTLAAAVFAALERPAFQASIAMLVPDTHRDRANATLQMAYPAAGVVAPRSPACSTRSLAWWDRSVSTSRPSSPPSRSSRSSVSPGRPQPRKALRCRRRSGARP